MTTTIRTSLAVLVFLVALAATAAAAEPAKAEPDQARATEVIDVALGAHATVFVGIPGSRGRPRVNLPVGVETFAGAELSVAGDKSEEGWSKPYYGPLEVGAGFQAAIIGVDLGIDPLEILDLAGGILFLDLKGDDYGPSSLGRAIGSSTTTGIVRGVARCW